MCVCTCVRMCVCARVRARACIHCMFNYFLQASNLHQNSDPDTSYTEILYAHLLDSDGSRLTYTHFTTKVNVGTLVEITFNRPVYIQKHKVCFFSILMY